MYILYDPFVLGNGLSGSYTDVSICTSEWEWRLLSLFSLGYRNARKLIFVAMDTFNMCNPS